MMEHSTKGLTGNRKYYKGVQGESKKGVGKGKII